MNITFIGGGNMAQAIIGGLLRSRKTPAASLQVVDPDPHASQRLAHNYPGIGCYQDAHGVIRDADIILLAVKPQQVKAAMKQLKIETNAHLIISIAAGIPLKALGQWSSGYSRCVRAMPNTPALIGEGITALYALPQHVTESDRQSADTILSSVGKTLWVSDEDEMNTVTAISGSGPAYVFLFMEAIEQAAAELNLPKNIAHELVLQTFIGASKLAVESDDALAVLRKRVTSKGGTTEAALNSLEHTQVKQSIISAVKAAAERSRELGNELTQDGG
jgi:pyrroline-5-carboxylate reductase